MAILKSVLGTVTQSMGNLTASRWKDKNVLKQKVPAVNGSKTPPQILQRLKFGFASKIAAGLAPVLRVGYRTAATSMTEQNMFQSRNEVLVSQVLGVDTPYFVLANLQLSAGNVLPAAIATVTDAPGNGGKLIKWVDNSDGINGLPDDIACIAAVSPTQPLAAALVTSITRSEGATGAAFKIPNDISEDFSWYYLFFKRAKTTACSPTTSLQAA